MKHIKYEAIIDRYRLERFQTSLLEWFSTQGRDLPWRRTRNPYAILVSEILLHQTTVQTVVPVYTQFLTRFPSIASLAAAPLEDIKAITDPLGYKVRGAWLKSIAETVRDHFQGRIPDTLDELMALPGVGRYTAGACLSFAYEKPAGVLDTNVARILTRFFSVPRNNTAEDWHRLWALAEAVVPTDDPWRFNQGLMDFGAIICRAKTPSCLTCPVADICPSRGIARGVGRAAEGEAQGVSFWERPRPRPQKRLGASEPEMENLGSLIGNCSGIGKKAT